MVSNLRLKFLRLRKSGAWSSVRLALFLVYLVLMLFLVMALVKKGSTFFGDTVPLPGEPSLRAESGARVQIGDQEGDVAPREVLDFEGLSKPGLGAHGAAVRFPEQSETDIQEQLKVRLSHRPDTSTIPNAFSTRSAALCLQQVRERPDQRQTGDAGHPTQRLQEGQLRRFGPITKVSSTVLLTFQTDAM